jgi:hypothetical protein
MLRPGAQCGGRTVPNAAGQASERSPMRGFATPHRAPGGRHPAAAQSAGSGRCTAFLSPMIAAAQQRRKSSPPRRN